ncbi:hypothetical protein DYB32_002441 [Aphanomyces invadans]|uniref:Uncharacterized protein n=1 Tax=Aphanomyces invadans TaxID=157072 RepID=A0A418B3E2_9STRA|nr:hypothetical protein DYB32_002441 [Aphanomyces invadans]
MHEPTKAAAAGDDSAHYVAVGRSNSQAIGAFIEWRETQIVMISLVVLDVAAAATGLVLDLLTQTGVIVPPLLGQLLQSFGGFTLFVFLIELTALVWVFQLAFFTHVGYSIDFLVAVEAAALKVQVLNDALEKEYQAKATLNLALQRYKDEVDTLKEALTIAAMSITRHGVEEVEHDNDEVADDSEDNGDVSLRQPRIVSPDDVFQDALMS